MEIPNTETVQFVATKNRRMADGSVKAYQYTETYTRKIKPTLSPALVATVREKAAASVQHKRILLDHPEIRNAYQLRKILA